MPFGDNDWLALTQEETLEPEIPICDPHHHMWDRRPARIPYQNYMLDQLYADLNSEPISEPNYLRFKAGIRKKPWNKNVVSLGLASGFLEPLESTSIHLIQTAIARLMTNFPDKLFNQHDIDYYNERTRLEYEQVRDFLILHYKATRRNDSPFWHYCRTMDIPDSLHKRIEIYKQNARLYRVAGALQGGQAECGSKSVSPAPTG